jgi:hypothetical protein
MEIIVPHRQQFITGLLNFDMEEQMFLTRHTQVDPWKLTKKISRNVAKKSFDERRITVSVLA